MMLMNRIRLAYTISVEEKYTIFSPIDGKDHPFRIKEKDGKFEVFKAWRDMAYDPFKWYKRKVCDNMDEVYEYLIKDWNKTTKIFGIGRDPI